MTLFNGSYREYCHRLAGQAEYARKAVKFSVPQDENSKTGFQHDRSASAVRQCESEFRIEIGRAVKDLGGLVEDTFIFILASFFTSSPTPYALRGRSQRSTNFEGCRSEAARQLRLGHDRPKTSSLLHRPASEPHPPLILHRLAPPPPHYDRWFMQWRTNACDDYSQIARDFASPVSGVIRTTPSLRGTYHIDTTPTYLRTHTSALPPLNVLKQLDPMVEDIQSVIQRLRQELKDATATV
ncbi:hypothetical protein C8J57DRAFT_1484835 [Mycena rebaudengoi]|nr:hypothetical protein C8J57DRAFT_1484835 [Mycena rebaudengoi]